jgi:hypothetical protein
MKEDTSISPSIIQDESDIDVVSLLKRMQQQLLFLERKIDLLLSRSQEGPSGERTSRNRPFRNGSFSKPFRSFDRSQHGKGEYGHGHGPREKGSAQGHFYERRPREKSRGPNPKKNQFPFKRKDRE